MLKNKNGITLITLIITIIILLILAGVTINMVLGENGLFNKAKTSVSKYENAQGKENAVLAGYKTEIDNARETVTMSKEELVNLIQSEIKKANEDKDTLVKLVPVGTVISYIGSSLPEGYLACDGSRYNVSEYPNLYDKLKELNHTGWAEANWTTEFTVPDLRGEFLRGTGTNSHVNEGNGLSVGIHQEATVLPRIWIYIGGDGKGSVVAELDKRDNSSVSNDTNYGDFYYRRNTRYYFDSGYYSTNSYESNGATYKYTTRPTNTSVLYCIKY